MIDELLPEFFLDTHAHLEAIEEDILKLDRAPQDMELIDDVFRRVHSVKGNAGMLGLSKIHTFGQEFETFLGDVRERRGATPAEIDHMFHGLDTLKVIVAETRVEKGLEESAAAPQSDVEPAPAPTPATAPVVVKEEAKAPAPAVPAPAAQPVQSAQPAPPAAQPPAEQKAQTAQPAEKKETAPEKDSSSEVTFLTFALAGERYGVEITDVREIILIEPITPIPNTKSFVAGVMNLRDQVVPIFELRDKLGIYESDGKGEEKNIIIIDIFKETTGLKVDEVTGIVTLTQGKITSPEMLQGNIPTDYLYGMGQTEEGTVILLNVKDICDPDEVLYHQLGEVQ